MNVCAYQLLVQSTEWENSRYVDTGSIIAAHIILILSYLSFSE